MGPIKSYACSCGANVTAGNSTAFFGDVINNGRFRLKTLTWQITFNGGGSPSFLPLEQNTILIYSLVLTPTANNPAGITLPIMNPSANISSNSTTLYFWTPGQYYWENLVFTNQLHFNINFANWHATASYIMNNSLIFEIEEIS